MEKRGRTEELKWQYHSTRIGVIINERASQKYEKIEPFDFRSLAKQKPVESFDLNISPGAMPRNRIVGFQAVSVYAKLINSVEYARPAGSFATVIVSQDAWQLEVERAPKG